VPDRTEAAQTPPKAPGADGTTNVSGPHDSEPHRWITVSEAERITGCNRGIISRAVDGNELKGNGKSGRARRIDAVDLARWQLQRVEGTEPGESNAEVERQNQEARPRLIRATLRFVAREKSFGLFR